MKVNSTRSAVLLAASSRESARRELADGAVHVWLASEDQFDNAAAAERFSALLSDDERARARGILIEGSRRLHLVACALKREVLSSYLPGTAPADLRFVRGVAGRPVLAPPHDASGIDFNLAHTRGLVALALTRGPHLGVDVERCEKIVPLAVARRFFSTIEADALDALPVDARPRRFLRLWTLKEAYLKAIGTGISGGLGSATFMIDDAGACALERAADPDAMRWSFRQFAVGGQHLLAFARLRLDGSRAPLVIEWHDFAAGAAGAVALRIEQLI